MNAASELLHQLENMDVHISINNNKLRINAPEGCLTPDLVEQIRLLKPAILCELEHGLSARSAKRRHRRHCRHPHHGMDAESVPSQDWEEETAVLIQWFLEDGQHRLPVIPLQLTPWLRIVDPARFKEAIHFGISVGPEKVKLWYPTFFTDLKHLKKSITNEETMK